MNQTFLADGQKTTLLTLRMAGGSCVAQRTKHFTVQAEYHVPFSWLFAAGVPTFILLRFSSRLSPSFFFIVFCHHSGYPLLIISQANTQIILITERVWTRWYCQSFDRIRMVPHGTFHYVASECNVSDGVSRHEFRLAQSMGWSHLHFKLDALFTILHRVATDLEYALTAAVDDVLQFSATLPLPRHGG